VISEAVVSFPYFEPPEIIFTPSNSSSGYSISISSDPQSHSFNIQIILDDFITALGIHRPDFSESFLTMLASEEVLMREWLTPDEDEAWKDL